ncbi:MAG TPA: DinB family protein [Micromonospora sp.]
MSPALPDEMPESAYAVLRAATGDERQILASFLDMFRTVLVSKAGGVSDADAHRRLLPSHTTLAGLLKHLALVERNWFQHLPAGAEQEVGRDGGGDFALDGTERIADLVAGYEAACADSRRAVAGLSLDDTFGHPLLGQVSLRWVYVHMIEETARHAGHADVVRELTDGTTGTF